MNKKFVVAVAVCLGVFLAACDSSGAVSSPPPQSPGAVTTHAAQEAISPDPNFDDGHTVLIVNSGFHPHWLVSACCEPITWKNTTIEQVSVVFDHVGSGSDLIPPGGTWVFTPTHPESITYHLGSNAAINGVVQVQQPFES